MKWSVPCTSMGLQAVALPYGNSSSAIKSALKKVCGRPSRIVQMWLRHVDPGSDGKACCRRLLGCVPQGHWKTLTFVAGLRRNGMTAPCVGDGSMNGKTFLAYVDQSLAP